MEKLTQETENQKVRIDIDTDGTIWFYVDNTIISYDDVSTIHEIDNSCIRTKKLVIPISLLSIKMLNRLIETFSEKLLHNKED